MDACLRSDYDINCKLSSAVSKCVVKNENIGSLDKETVGDFEGLDWQWCQL
jgi:hypothetical protein